MSNTTDKLIDDIIELILGDMDCHHEVDHNENGVHTSVEYSLNDEMKIRDRIRALLKPRVTEEWIEEKAKKWLEENYDNSWNISPIRFVQLLKDFADLLVEEIQ